MTDSRVRVLPGSVVSKIAAGEMIERPVSVVKELVENALDAGASRITVHVDGSLDRSLSVLDDGIGMSRADAELALEPHATSKIRSADDLFRLTTLGFRGEALSSIAAVSALTLTSAAVDGEPATEIEVVGGKRLEVRQTSRARGTTVRVRDLFFNVPVRRKFMKTERGELRVAVRLLSHFALAHPEVAFALERPGGTSHVYDAAPSLSVRARDVFGKSTVDQMLEVVPRSEGIEVTGLIGRPEQSRATRDYQIMIVNGRAVVSPLLNHAVKTGYRDLIPPDRQPMSVLHVNLDPGLVDANVHPTKREVKFAREGMVFEAVRDAVAHALSVLSPAVRHGGGADLGTEPSRPDSQLRIPDGGIVRARTGPGPGDVLELWRPLVRERAESASPETATTPASDDAVPVDPQPPREPVARPDEPKFWQLHRRYIFAQTASGAIVIDQHAAHERILYERALARLDGEPPAGQRLLFPEPIELTPSEFELFGEIQGELERLGFEIEPFGGNSVVVRAIPDDVYGWDRGQLLRDILDEYVNAGRSVREVRERMARSFACRAAVKSGTALRPEEMRELIDALFATTTPHGDPHGRPTLIPVRLDELDRRFGRS